MRCEGCEKQLRAHGVTLDEAPGTVATGRAGLCQSCTARRGKLAPIPENVDGPCLIVKTALRPSTYRAFSEHARALGIDIGELLSRLADRAVTHAHTAPSSPAPTRKATTPTLRPADYIEDDIDARIRALNAADVNDTEIARQIGLSQASTFRRRKLLGLDSPARNTRRAGVA